MEGQLQQKFCPILTFPIGHITATGELEPGFAGDRPTAPGTGDVFQLGISQSGLAVFVDHTAGCLCKDLGGVLLQVFLKREALADGGGVFGIVLLFDGRAYFGRRFKGTQICLILYPLPFYLALL